MLWFRNLINNEQRVGAVEIAFKDNTSKFEYCVFARLYQCNAVFSKSFQVCRDPICFTAIYRLNNNTGMPLSIHQRCRPDGSAMRYSQNGLPAP